MVNSCSVYRCKSNYKTTGNGNYVSVFKFPDNTTKQTEWFRNYQIKTSKLQKHPEYVSNIFSHTSSSDTICAFCLLNLYLVILWKLDFKYILLLLLLLFPCANGDPDIIVSIENTILNIRDYR